MFSENLNSKFRIFPEGAEALESELVEFKEFDHSPEQEQFSVMFRGPLETFLPQGMYKMEHDKIGTFGLFLVPVRRDHEGFYYEAAFNRFINKA